MKDSRYSLRYVLGLFNSKLINYWYKAYFDNVNINPTQVRLIPIHPIDFSNAVNRERHDEIVKLVERIQKVTQASILKKKPEHVDFSSKEIQEIDSEIDHLVYKLYGLTEEEIKIVDNSKK